MNEDSQRAGVVPEEGTVPGDALSAGQDSRAHTAPDRTSLSGSSSDAADQSEEGTVPGDALPVGQDSRAHTVPDRTSHSGSSSDAADRSEEGSDGDGSEMEPCPRARSTGDIPDEILDHLLTFVLPYDDMRSCRQVSRRWQLAVRRVERKLRRLLARSLDELSVSWFHYDTPNPVPGSPSGAHRVITKRCAHSAVMHDGRMYVFGGCSSRMTTFNDLWCLELGQLDWQRPPAVGNYPSPKAYASLVTYGDKLVLFGGWSQAAPYPNPLHECWKLFDELHIYHTKECRWQEVRGVTASAPEAGLPGTDFGQRWPPRMARHAASVHGHQMVVTGGLHHHHSRFPPTNEVWVFDFLTEEWRHQRCSEPAPSARFGHSQIALDDRHMLLVGGSGAQNQLRHDAWLLELGEPSAEWRWHQLTVAGTESAPHQLWCQSGCQVGNKLVVLGRCRLDAASLSAAAARTARGAVHPPSDRRVASTPRAPSGAPATGFSGGPSGSSGGAGGAGASVPPSARTPPPSSGPETGQFSRRVPPPSAPDRSAPRPSVRPNARGSRDLRLAGLQRMQERLAAAAAERAAPWPRPRCRPPLTAGYRLVSAGGRRPLALHVLDASRAVSERRVGWRHCQPQDAPDERILFSLVAARGELVLFGGIQNMVRAARADTDPEHDDSAPFNALSFVAIPCDMFS